MLDLSIANKSFMLVKIPNGEEIKILPPKRNVMAILEKLQDTKEMDDIYSAVATILSNNRDEKKYTMEDVDDFDIGDVQKILTGFTEFVGNIQKN